MPRRLTPRELQLLALVTAMHPRPQVARALRARPRQLKRIAAGALAKLECSGAALAQVALRILWAATTGLSFERMEGPRPLGEARAEAAEGAARRARS